MYTGNAMQQIIMIPTEVPYTVRLRPDNQWMILESKVPWDLVEKIYESHLCMDNGRNAKDARLAFTLLYVRAKMGLSQRDAIDELHENHYIQHFAGYNSEDELPHLVPSDVVEFEKRFTVEDLALINECICTGKVPEDPRLVDRDREDDSEMERLAQLDPAGDSACESIADLLNAASQEATQEEHHSELVADSESSGSNRPCDGDTLPDEAAGSVGNAATDAQDTTCTIKEKPESSSAEPANHGKLIMDATVAPQDIKFPRDLELLDDCREALETAIDILWEYVPHDGHKYPYCKGKARQNYLNISKSKKNGKKKLRKAIGKHLGYVAAGIKQYKRLRNLAPDVKLPSWLEARLEVIPTVYAQQKEMYDNRTSRVDNRIVSLSQPFVRPIYRGKKPQATEFGQKLHLSVVDGFTFLEQTSWSNYNEAGDLIPTVEAYRKRFGFYPEAVLADEIYRNRENRRYCKEHGIRLSGKPLGRRPKDEDKKAEERALEYQDMCDRNEVEGRNGNLKRRYSLDRIMCKLAGTSKSEAAWGIIAMNLRHHLKLHRDQERKMAKEQRAA